MNDTSTQTTQPVVTKHGAPDASASKDAGKYFRYMAEFVGFTRDDEQAIVKTKPIVEKHLARIVSDFYEHLLRYPPTRTFFLDKNGNIDIPHLQLRMRHNANFWRRTIEGNYDDE